MVTFYLINIYANCGCFTITILLKRKCVKQCERDTGANNLLSYPARNLNIYFYSLGYAQTVYFVCVKYSFRILPVSLAFYPLKL
jgi:hypothetical protein